LGTAICCCSTAACRPGLGDGFTVKRLVHRRGGLALQAAHPAYPLLPLEPDGDHQLLGVVRHVIRRL
jgi:DNA polymerase V